MLKVQYFGNWCSLGCGTTIFTATLLVFYMQFCQISITTANEGYLVIFVETNARFTCNNGTTIHRRQVCDGKKDCPDHEDELGCARTCGPQEFKCSGIGTEACIPAWFRCDGRIDCYDETDELNCTGVKPVEPLRPPYEHLQNIFEGDTFEHSCFVYGEPISNIHWYTKNDYRLGLPNIDRCTSTRNGNTSRLTCPKVNFFYSGPYHCEGENPKKFTVYARPSGDTVYLTVHEGSDD